MSEKQDTLLRALCGGKQVIKEWSHVARGADKSIIEIVVSDLNEAISIAENHNAEIAQAVTAETARCVGNLTSAMGLDMAAYDALGIAVEEIVPPTVMRTWEIAIKALEAKG